MITDRHVPCNKPDIVIQEKKLGQVPNHRCGHPKGLQHPEEGHREDKQVCRSPD